VTDGAAAAAVAATDDDWPVSSSVIIIELTLIAEKSLSPDEKLKRL